MFVLEDCMAWLANRSSKVFSSVLDSHFAALEVTRVQWMALYYMNRNPEQKQTELAERLNCKSAALARLLDRMEKDGMLTRSVNAENRRSNRIELTEKGRRLCAEGTAIAERFMDPPDGRKCGKAPEINGTAIRRREADMPIRIRLPAFPSCGRLS